MTATEEEIRAGLRDALAAVPVTSPPAEVIVHRGARIRWRRRAAVAAALAALVAGAVALPVSVPLLAPAVVSPSGGPVTVSPPPPGAPGLIASGVADGRPWQARLQGNAQFPRAAITGFAAPLQTLPDRDPVAFVSAVSQNQVALLGAVRADVTSVTVWLAGQAKLHLVPVRFGPYRWVAVVVPIGLRVHNILAYGPAGQVGHTVPYGQHIPNNDEVVGWMAPGQTGPAPVTVKLPVLVVGAQARSVTRGPVRVHLGPWGRCYAGGYIHASSFCDPGPSTVFHNVPVGQDDCNFTKTIESCLATTELRVSLVRLRLSNGTVWKIRPIAVGPARYFDFVISNTHVIRWTAFNRAGQQLGTGADWSW